VVRDIPQFQNNIFQKNRISLDKYPNIDYIVMWLIKYPNYEAGVTV
jgi:hypothetical protein